MATVIRSGFGLGLLAVALTVEGTAHVRAQELPPEVQALYGHAQKAQETDHPESAVADYEKILKLAPELAPAYNNLGRLFYNLGQYPEAIATLTKGLALSPNMAPAEVMLGASYVKLERFSEALPPLEAGVKAMPEDRFARVTLAQTLMGLHRVRDAIAQLDHVLERNPKDQEGWYLLGKLHLELSQEAFEQVQTIDPAAPLAHQLAGEVMESMQNTPGAVHAYKQAIAAAPENLGALEHLADLYWRTGDWPNASKTYKTLLARQPRNCAAHWRLAEALDESGESPQAGLDEVNTALAQCASLVQARAERARLLLRLGRPAEALPDLEIAERAAPNEALVQRLLAQAYRALGDRPRADAANQKFLQLQQTQHTEKERHAARLETESSGAH